MTDTIPDSQWRDIQALVFRGWKKLPWAAYLFVRLPDRVDAARAWLQTYDADVVYGEVPPASSPESSGPLYLRPAHLAFKPEGLRKLGVPDAVVERFPQEAKVGMEARARVLGDRVNRDNQPSEWNLDVQRADALVIVYAATADLRTKYLAEHRERIESRGGEVVAIESSAQYRDNEPFGFADGLAQPKVKGQPRGGTVMPAQRNDIAAGEVVLGYTNEYGLVPQSPRYQPEDGLGRDFDFGRNGSFLVFRKLEQDVSTFWQTMVTLGEKLRGEPVGPDGWKVPEDPRQAAHWLAARAMGRWTNGNSTVTCPVSAGERLPREQLNAFTYADDPHGLRCPIGSHVRRANPRDARGGGADDSWTVVNRHRILRRGRAYGETVTPEQAMAGEKPPGDCGLLFVALQANIAHGFEFVQQIWNNNPGFHGLYQERDPIAGAGGTRFTIPAEPVRLTVQMPTARKPEELRSDEEARGLPRFVTPRGGGYFFLPSRHAIDCMLGRLR